MKKLLLFMGILLISITAIAATPSKKKKRINKVDPPFWYAKMHNPSLQLMVYGKNINTAKVKIHHKEIIIDSIASIDSPNYLLIYLNIPQKVKAGKIPLSFEFEKGEIHKIMYDLRERSKDILERKSFDASDVLYMLMPDRFANGNPNNDVIKGMRTDVCNRKAKSLRHGGDIEGIRQHLDYFTDLGVTTLWMTPVLENDMSDHGEYSSYHGYATTDYYHVDRRFGSNKEYQDLITEAHKKGLKVVMDMIFNHCGSDHIWLTDPPMKNWFNHPDHEANFVQTSYKLTPAVDPYASKIDTDEMGNGWFVKTMPDLNQKNSHVLRYLIQNSFWWIEYSGINGIRMDTYPYANAKEMAKWMKELNEAYPNFNVVGETWVTVPAYTATWQKDSKLSAYNSHLKTVMDFALFESINRARCEETDGWWNGYNKVYNTFVYDYLYPNPLSVMAFFENHDTDRFLKNGQNILALKQAMTLLLTIPRIPQLYYGSEVMMNGTKAKTDGDVRKDFPGGWPNDKINAFTAEGRTKIQNEMYNFTKKLLHWRKGNEIISKGSMIHFMPYQGVYVYSRSYKGKTIVVLLNGNCKALCLPLHRYKEIFKDKKSGINIINDQKIDLIKGEINLQARESLIIVL